MRTIDKNAIRVDNVLAFHYNGDGRCMQVEKVTGDYVQGKMLPWDGVLPTRRFASFRFDKMESAIELVQNQANMANQAFDLADVR